MEEEDELQSQVEEINLACKNKHQDSLLDSTSSKGRKFFFNYISIMFLVTKLFWIPDFIYFVNLKRNAALG